MRSLLVTKRDFNLLARRHCFEIISLCNVGEMSNYSDDLSRWSSKGSEKVNRFEE